VNVTESLIKNINQKSNPSVVGLDPRIGNLPPFLKERSLQKFGNTLQAAADALYHFNEGILHSIHTIVPAVKLQMACYEVYGAFGVEAFERTVLLAKKLDLTVIDDSKRNDIGSTAELYALAHLGSPPLIEGVGDVNPVDFLTINPWLGSDGIEPFVQQCQQHQKGIFILTKTSNPSSAEFQGDSSSDSPMFREVSRYVHQLSKQHRGQSGYSSIGSVVGATHPGEAEVLRSDMPYCYFLVPGYGTQGGTAEDTMPCFNQDGYGAIINSSRKICFAWQDPQYKGKYPNPEDYGLAAKEESQRMKEELLQALKTSGKLPSNW